MSVGTLLRLITEDEKTITKWEIRVEVSCTLLLSLMDPVTDALVINEWMLIYRGGYLFSSTEYTIGNESIHARYKVMWILAAYIGIVILVMSEIVSTFIYVRWHKDHVTIYGVLLHLIGLGAVHDAMSLLKNPVRPPWDSKIGESNQVAAETWLRFFHSRAVESVCEALPFAIFQCFILVYGQSYHFFLIIAVVLSWVCTSFPIPEFIRIRCYEHGIATLSYIEQFIIILLWISDMMARSLPIIYLIANSKTFEYKTYKTLCAGERECNLRFVDEWVVAIIILGYFVLGYIFLLTLQHCKKLTGFRILKIAAFAVMLLFTSHPKLSNVGVGWKLGVETFIRFSISIGLAIYLRSRNIIEIWQVLLFSALTFFSGCLQIYLFCRVTAGHYKGCRICPGMKREPGFGMYKGGNKEPRITRGMNKSENAVIISRVGRSMQL